MFNPYLADTKLHPLDCSCLSHCSFEDGLFSSSYLLIFPPSIIVILFTSLPCVFSGPHAGSNYLQPLLGPLSNMLQMLQECSQLELALRVLVNSYGSCLQHITSNVMDMKLSIQV